MSSAKYFKALRGPLPQVPLIPTGGVNLETAADFLKAGSGALGVGGELVLADALKTSSPNESPSWPESTWRSSAKCATRWQPSGGAVKVTEHGRKHRLSDSDMYLPW